MFLWILQFTDSHKLVQVESSELAPEMSSSWLYFSQSEFWVPASRLPIKDKTLPEQSFQLLTILQTA